MEINTSNKKISSSNPYDLVPRRQNYCLPTAPPPAQAAASSGSTATRLLQQHLQPLRQPPSLAAAPPAPATAFSSSTATSSGSTAGRFTGRQPRCSTTVPYFVATAAGVSQQLPAPRGACSSSYRRPFVADATADCSSRRPAL
jgi:hypothetical protein